MKTKIWIYFFILLVFSGSNLSLRSSNTFTRKDSIEILNEDYLKKIPDNEYIIGPGDNLNIVVSRDYPELDTIQSVDGEGTLYLPKLKRVYVDGLTKSELINLLNLAYKEYVKYPSVEVIMVNYRPIRVYVKGEVLNPGLQVLEGAINEKPIPKDPFLENAEIENNLISSRQSFFPSVFDAIRLSGGITLYSDLSKIKVIRLNPISKGGGKIMTQLNFQEVLVQGNNLQNIRIYDSDIIIVGKSNDQNSYMLSKAISSNLNSKFINVFIAGRVNNPGKINVSKASSLNDAIDIAGIKVIKGDIKFIRFENDGTIDKRKFAFRRNRSRGTYKNPNLRDGDLIIVGDSFLSTSNEVIKEVTAPFAGIFSTYGLIKAISD